MALVKRERHRREIPHEPGQWVDICRLGIAELTIAEQTQTNQAMRAASTMGAEVLLAIEGMTKGQAAPAVQTRTRYDKLSMLRFGVVAWSYPEPVKPETIDQLDRETADWLFDELIALHFPPAADAGEAVAPSIAS